MCAMVGNVMTERNATFTWKHPLPSHLTQWIHTKYDMSVFQLLATVAVEKKSLLAFLSGQNSKLIKFYMMFWLACYLNYIATLTKFHQEIQCKISIWQFCSQLPIKAALWGHVLTVRLHILQVSQKKNFGFIFSFLDFFFRSFSVPFLVSWFLGFGFFRFLPRFRFLLIYMMTHFLPSLLNWVSEDSDHWRRTWTDSFLVSLFEPPVCAVKSVAVVLTDSSPDAIFTDFISADIFIFAFRFDWYKWDFNNWYITYVLVN